MKYWHLLLACAPVVCAQSTLTLYTTDLNGHRVPVQTVLAGPQGQKTELSETVNGRVVPREQTETRVLSEGPQGRTTETITRHYTLDGQLSETERVVSEEQKQGEGKSLVRATISRSDLHGRLLEAERRTIETATKGTTTESNVTIARPAAGGRFETAEARKVVTVVEGDVTRENELIQRPSVSGQLADAARNVREVRKSGETVTESLNYFEVGYAYQMQLLKQQTSVTSKGPGGAYTTEINIYGVGDDGVTRTEQGGTKIKEQQVIVRTPGADGSYVETAHVRRPTLADPNRFGAPAKLSETVCRGKCDAAETPKAR